MSTIHTVRTDEVSVPIEIECSYCGFAGVAEVRSSGTGVTSSVVFSEHARRAAAEQAFEDLQHQALVTAALLPCPKCGRRSRGAVVKFTVMTALGVIVLLGIGAVAWTVQVGFWRFLTTGLVLAGTALVVWKKRQRFLDVESLLEGIEVRAKLPVAAVLKLGAAKPITPTKAPPPRPIEDPDPARKPKLLG